jgi:hypothetical protein
VIPSVANRGRLKVPDLYKLVFADSISSTLSEVHYILAKSKIDAAVIEEVSDRVYSLGCSKPASIAAKQALPPLKVRFC